MMALLGTKDVTFVNGDVHTVLLVFRPSGLAKGKCAIPVWSVGGVLISLPYAVNPKVDKPPNSVTHGQCDARPTVTYPATRHHRPRPVPIRQKILLGNKGACVQTTFPRLLPESGAVG